MHFPGNRKGRNSDQDIRMPLVRVLRAGVVDWQATGWSERFTADSGATFDAFGGFTSETPKYGWPADFWSDHLAAADGAWRDNSFISFGRVTLWDAPTGVLQWLRGNDEARARWCRMAQGVTIDWNQARKPLGGAGWKVWGVRNDESVSRSPIAAHYRAALIELIRTALREPHRFESEPVSELLRDAFDLFAPDKIPDYREVERLAKHIETAINSRPDDDLAPI